MTGGRKLKRSRGRASGVVAIIVVELVVLGVIAGKVLLPKTATVDIAMNAVGTNIPKRTLEVATSAQDMTSTELSYGQPAMRNIAEGLGFNTEVSELADLMATEYYVDLMDTSERLVLIDISAQKVWAFEDEEIMMESPVVTGLKNRYDTQLGIYTVLLKRQNYTMRGSYGSARVNYWMRFNNPYAQGLHDASWRSEFGGEIYTTDGSHGCVNLPPDFTAELYEFVEVGTPIIVQE